MELNCRETMVAKIQAILGDEYFIYGSYKRRPNHLPYGNYAEDDQKNIFGDDGVVLARTWYIVRLVTSEKDFALERQIEAVFNELEVGWEFFNDEEIDDEKVHVKEWVVNLVEDRAS